MKTFAALALTFLVAVPASSDAQEYQRSYVISPDARGSGPVQDRLDTFGRLGQPIEPIYGAPRYSGEYNSESLFSPQEHRRMVKSLYRKNKTGPTDGLLRRSVQNATRPLRSQDR